LRYCRSSVFTFVFFKQKVTGISSGKNNKGCRIFHNESNKIGLAFFSDFSVIFYAIYKKQEINLTIGVHLLQRGPWKDFCVCNVAPRGGGRCGSGEIPASTPPDLAGEGWGRV
jgi:hypothetical protein